MKKRYYWLAGGTGLVLVMIVAGMLYAAHFASTVNQPHTAPGAATVTDTPIPSNGLRTFQIVPAQTTASYSVYENLIFQNKPNNDAVGTTHSVQGSFKIRTSASPLVAAMNITVDLRTLQSCAGKGGGHDDHRNGDQYHLYDGLWHSAAQPGEHRYCAK